MTKRGRPNRQRWSWYWLMQDSAPNFISFLKLALLKKGVKRCHWLQSSYNRKVWLLSILSYISHRLKITPPLVHMAGYATTKNNRIVVGVLVLDYRRWLHSQRLNQEVHQCTTTVKNTIISFCSNRGEFNNLNLKQFIQGMVIPLRYVDTWQ